jgi:hypothetical protein
MYKGDTLANLLKINHVLNAHLCKDRDSLTERD